MCIPDIAQLFEPIESVNLKSFVAYDINKDFIKQEIDWIELALKSNKPFLGICLGAQMLAKSLGGTVGKNSDNSYEIGFFDIIPTKIGDKMFENQKTFFQWHNEGFRVPRECLVLAEGKKFHQQAFKFNNAFGLQFHPESILTDWGMTIIRNFLK